MVVGPAGMLQPTWNTSAAPGGSFLRCHDGKEFYLVAFQIYRCADLLNTTPLLFRISQYRDSSSCSGRHLLPALRADRDFIYEMHLQLPLVF
jgi:hypothetical protein